MGRAPQVKGWCPDVFAPMQAKDGLLVRVRSPLRGFDAYGLRDLAVLAQRFGNGCIELTNRGNVQLRGFAAERLAEAQDFARDAELVESDPALEKRRIVMVSPLAGLDPAEHPRTMAVAQAVADFIRDEPCMAGLHPKFSVAVEGGGVVPCGVLAAELSLWADVSAWRVVCSHQMSAPLNEAEALRAMALLLERVAMDADLARPSRVVEAFCACFPDLGWKNIPAQSSGSMLVGALPRGMWGVGVVLGRMQGDALARVAGAMMAHGMQGERVRVTPFRGMVMPQKLAEVLSHEPWLIMQADDPRLRVKACIGALGCAHAGDETRDIALGMAPLVPEGRLLHVSGCVKGCAHPRVADVTLVTHGEDHYDVVLNGRARDEAMARKVVPSAVCDVLAQIWKEDTLHDDIS
ncbi:precorrin-3B synthase [Neokomagataea anthophila]|uniref:Precorrin-3B synthase n=1 Tax=Neokomagataea anthophila TaxID=2826925 RepID=A0ABS5E923_9PROT|nr:precorrin-3B synthase [Neokomagataea anthophila]MBR0560407.1 precorrin-3B synthase [Neokomagataea anthophila]